MSLESKIRVVAEGLLADESHFIVDVSSSGSVHKPKVRILLDGDSGVTIDDCARLSRELGELIENEGIIESAYTLEVSSPGVDQPLEMERQYRKNIGRKLKVRNTDGKEFKGELIHVDAEGIDLKIVRGKGKAKQEVQEHFPFDKIEKAIVQISFK